MKTLNKVLAIATMLTATSQAATTISGVVGPQFKGADGVTNINSGSLVMLIADVEGNGFLNLATGGAIQAGLNGLSGKTLTGAQAGVSVGSLFGGDTVVSTSLSGSGSIGGILTGVDVTNFVGKNFALVWFNATPSAVAANIAGQAFGVMRLSDWTLPAADSGATFSMSATDGSGATSYYSTSAAITAAQVGGGFFTGSGTAADAGSTGVRAASFLVVPEPSAALLGAIGALGLLRRRRN